MGEQQGASPRHAFRQIASNAAKKQQSLANAAPSSIHFIALQLIHCYAADTIGLQSSSVEQQMQVQPALSSLLAMFS